MTNCSLTLDKSFNDSIITILDNVNNMNKDDTIGKVRLFIEEINKLHKQYELDDYFDSVHEVLEDLSMFMPVQEELLKINFQAIPNTSIEAEESKTDSLASVLEKALKSSIKGLFLHSYFPLASTSRLTFERNFRNSFIQALLFYEGQPISTDKDRNKSIDKYREQLKQDILNAFRLVEYDQLKSRSHNWKSFTDKAGEFLHNTPITLIRQLPLIDTLTPEQQSKLKAWLAWIILKNFDNLIRQLFGKGITIRNFGEYDFGVDKYTVNYGDNNSTSWRDEDEDVDETEELASVPRYYLESLTLLDDEGLPIPGNLLFDIIKGTMRDITNLFNSSDAKVQFTGPTILNILINYMDNLYRNGTAYSTEIYEKYIMGKTLKLIMAEAREKPALLMPVLFRCLMPMYDEDNVNQNPLPNNYKKSVQVKRTISSLYYHLFDSNSDSLFKMTPFNPDEKSLYNDIVTLLLNIVPKPMLQYKDDYDEGFLVIPLSQGIKNERLNTFSNNLYGKYQRKNPLIQFDSFEVDTNNFKGEKPQIIIKKNGKEIKVNKDGRIYGTLTKEELSEMAKEILDVSDDIIYTYFELLNGSITDLLKLLGHLIYNYYAGLVVRNSETVSNVKFLLKNYYAADKLNLRFGQLQPQLINSSDFVTFQKISDAKDIQEGYASLGTVRDGERKQVSIIGLPSLMSTVTEIWENHAKQQDSPTLEFSIFDIFEGFELVRDFNSSDLKKQAKLFTINELAKAGILFDFYGDMDPGTSEKPKNGFLRVMGPVVSDKANLVKLKFKWDSTINIDGKPVRLRDLSVDLLKFLVKKEFGSYYSKVLENIKSQISTINKYVNEAVQYYNETHGTNFIPTLFDYLLNFSLANEAYQDAAADILHEAIYFAQQANENVELIDEVMYINNKGRLENNPSIIHQCNLWIGPLFAKTSLDTDESLNNFWARKEAQLVTDFLQYNVNLRVKEGQNIRKGFEQAVAKNTNFIKGENIAVAKIGDYYLTSLQDFKNWYPYTRLIKEVGLSDLIDVDSPTFDLLYTIYLINTYQVKWGINWKDVEVKLPRALKTEAKNLYIKKRREYNPEITDEQLEKDWEKKIENEGLNDREKLKEYVHKHIALDLIESHFNGNPQEAVQKAIPETPTRYTLTVNPEILRHNLFDFFLGEEFILATTGTYVSHPTKVKTNIYEREAALFGQAVKRYVSYTATKHKEATNLLNGIPLKLNFAIFEDDFDSAFSISGAYKPSGTKPFDGASFYSVAMNYLDNNSLGGDAMGVNKKPFMHHQGQKSGIGFILKTAGFALTNDKIRTSNGFDARLNKIMLDIKWTSVTHKPVDWTVDYNRNHIDYGTWYVCENGQWYAYSNPTLTTVEKQAVDIQGNPIEEKGDPVPISVTSNWDLWNLFGGAYSGHFDESGNLTYENDNSSVERLVTAMNMVGFKKEGVDHIYDQTDVDQVLKRAQIHIIATGGAVKYGGANINSNKAYYDDGYHVTTMLVNAYDLGEQLDAEHNAEDESVALMTLVINSLGARGYSRPEALECYEVLSIIAETMYQDGLRGLYEKYAGLTSTTFHEAFAGIIYKILQRVSSTDGNMLNAIARSLNSLKDFKWEEIQDVFPVSHPAILGKIVSSIAGQLEKGIRLKFRGGMLVLNPSNRRFNIINGKLSGYYNDHMEELVKLELDNINKPLSQAWQIRVGFNYRRVDNNELIEVNNPIDFYEVEKLLNSGVQVYETNVGYSQPIIGPITDETIIANGKPLGHDLAPWNCTFSDGEHTYSIWQLDSVKQLWASPRETFRLIKLQHDLNAISEGVELTVMLTDGKIVRVVKSLTKTDGYEAIMPLLYASKFGLKIGDNVSDIANDKYFFIKRAAQNWTSKIDDKSLYDIELKTLNGNHTYLSFTKNEYDPYLTKIDLDLDIDGDVVYRLVDGERVYSIPYHYEGLKIVPDVEVYKTVEGVEIIYTDNITHFLDLLSYFQIAISPEAENYQQILTALAESKNKVVKRKLKTFVDNIKESYNKEVSDVDDLLSQLLGEEIEEELTLQDIVEDLFLANSIIEGMINDNLQMDLEIDALNKTLKSGKKIVQTPRIKSLIKQGRDVHTSFLASLELIVSRTPAQCHQSFMAMQIAAFAPELKNSAYVNRLQLFLQGSDYALK